MGLESYINQIKANAAAIQQILDDAKQIKDHSSIIGSVSSVDLILLQKSSDDSTVKVTVADLNFGVFNPTLGGIAKGDIIVFNGIDWVNLGVGTNGQVLSADSLEASGLKWIDANNSLTLHQVTTNGNITSNTARFGKLEIDSANASLDVIGGLLQIYNSNNIRIRNTTNDTELYLDYTNGVGFRNGGYYYYFKSNNLTTSRTYQVPDGSGIIPLTVNGYAANSLGEITIPTVAMPLTTKGDIFTYSTVPERLGVGTDGYLLSADSLEPTGLKWVSPSAGTSPLTTKGDLFGYTTGDARIPVGTDGQSLFADSAQASGLIWRGIVEADITDLQTYYLASNPSGYISANQSITLSGDISGTGTTAITTTLQPNSINGKTLVTAVAGDFVLLWDATDSALKKANVSDFLGGGVSTFIDLTDTDPTTYVGSAGYLVRVNSTPNGLEFVDGSTLFTNTSEWATYTGTRAGSNLVVTLGDYDNSGNSTKVLITDAGVSQLGFYANTFLFNYNTTGWQSEFDFSTLTSDRVYTFPNATGTLALQSFVTGQGYITGNQSITLSGDVTGSGTTAITTSVVALRGVALDATVGTPNDGDILVYRSAGSDWVLETKPVPGGGGATQLSELSDVTSAVQTAGFVLASSGGNYAGRALITTDIPNLSLTKITDVTATAGELNLLDLSGLTVGWVLSADSATTASWKAPTGGGSQNLESVLTQGNLADSPSTLNYTLFNILTDLGTEKVEFGLDDGTTYLSLFQQFQGGFYLNAQEYINGFRGQFFLDESGVVLKTSNGTSDMNIKMLVSDATVDEVDFIFKTPSGTVANTDYYIPLSVNGTFADTNGNITIGGGTYTASNGLTMVGNDVQFGGTLTSNVVMTGSTFSTQWNGTNTSYLLNLNNTAGSGGTALRAHSDNAYGVHATSSGTLNEALYAINTNSGTNNYFASVKIGRGSTGTVATNFGSGIEFELENSTNSLRQVGDLKFIWTDPIDASRTAKFVVSLVNSGVVGDKMTVTASGDVQATTFNGVALTTGGSATNFLNEQGNYAPAGGGTIGGTIGIGQIAYGSALDTITGTANFSYSGGVVAFNSGNYIFSSTQLEIGVDNAGIGQIYLYGAAGTAGGGTIRLYNDAGNDTNVDYWRIITGGGSNPNLRIDAAGVPRMIFKELGGLQFDEYGGGTITGTIAYYLGVDSNGNVLEGTPAGGSGDDVSTFAEKTGALVGTDRLVGLSGATDFSETISGIPLSIFNNDSGWTSNAGDMVLASTQTNSGAKTFLNSTILFRNPANTFSYTLVSGAIAAARNITLPVLTGNDTFVFEAHTQTLTNKTLTSPTLTTPTINTSIAGTVTSGGNITATNFLIGATATQSMSNKTITASTFNGVTLTTAGSAITYLDGTGNYSTPTGGGGNVSNTGTPLNNQLAVWTNATTVEGTTGLTYDSTTGIFGVFNDALGSDTLMYLGKSDLADVLTIQANYNGGSDDLINVNISTVSTSATANAGQINFSIDGVPNILQIVDAGIIVTGTIVKSGGTSSQFLKADGSIDSSVYLTTLALGGLSDVTISAIGAGEILVYTGSEWNNATLAEAGIASTSHNHSLDTLNNVTITANSSGEILKWNGAAWINNTLAEAGISAIGHNHNGETIVVGNHGTASTDEVVNVCYGTSATPPSAATVTEGALYIQYTA